MLAIIVKFFIGLIILFAIGFWFLVICEALYRRRLHDDTK